MTYYAKLWTDILDDPKLIRGARLGAKRLVLLPWLIAFAKRADDGGRLSVAGLPAEPVDIARSVPGATPRHIEEASTELQSLGILARDDDGALRFAAWHRRNWMAPSDTKEMVRERVTKHRARKRGDVTGNVTTPVTRDVTTEVTTEVTNAVTTPVTTARSRDKDLDKDLDKDEDIASVSFDRVWRAFPRRAGANPRRGAEQAWNARIRDGEDPAVMAAGAERYRLYCETEGMTGGPYVMQGKRFFGPGKEYLEPWLPAPEDPEEERLNALRRQQDADQAAIEERVAARLATPSGNGARP